MLTRLSHATAYVLDQDAALAFYTEKLGFEVRSDVSMGEAFEGAGAGSRWLTVGPPTQPDLEIILSDVGMGRDEATTAQFRDLVAKGAFGIGVLETDDCQRTYEELSAKGVDFVSAPSERPYGIEAVLRDDSGNWFSVTERREA